MAQTRMATGERQRQIIDAARKIIATRGMEDLSIRDLAKQVGLSEAAIYRHFPSKKDILLLLIDDIERTLLDTVDRAVSEKSKPLESLENVFKAHLSYVEQRRGVSLIVISETLRLADMNLRKRMFEVVNHYISRIEGLLAQGVKSGQISQEIDLSTAALTFFAIIHTTVTLWALSDSEFSLPKRHKPLWDSYTASIAVDGK
jgi:AcrR family transcriptional regulator